MKASVEEAQKRYPTVFAAYWTGDFKQVLNENRGKFHIVAISCEKSYVPHNLFEMVAQSGFQGKVYTLIPMKNGSEVGSEHEWPTRDTWYQEMFRMLVFREME